MINLIKNKTTMFIIIIIVFIIILFLINYYNESYIYINTNANANTNPNATTIQPNLKEYFEPTTTTTQANTTTTQPNYVENALKKSYNLINNIRFKNTDSQDRLNNISKRINVITNNLSQMKQIQEKTAKTSNSSTSPADLVFY